MKHATPLLASLAVLGMAAFAPPPPLPDAQLALSGRQRSRSTRKRSERARKKIAAASKRTNRRK